MSTLAQLDPSGRARRDGSSEALASLAAAVSAAARCDTLRAALRGLAEPLRALAGADAALVRVLDRSCERLEVVAVAGPNTLAAELEGSQLALADLPERTLSMLEDAPEPVRRAAARAAGGSLLLVPVRVAGTAASVELLRGDGSFSADDRLAAELGAAQVALVLRAFDAASARTVASLARPALELAGEALAAALDGDSAAAEIARVAAAVAGARVAIVWQAGEDGAIALAGAHGLDAAADLAAARELATRVLARPTPARALPAERLPDGCGVSTAIPLGRPPAGVLQLLHPPGEGPDAEQLARLGTFGVRAAHALRTSARARLLAAELERTRALVAVIGQATAELSVAHTLQTAVERVSDLLGIERVAVYLRGPDERLEPAASRGELGRHGRLAERLLDVALGPARGRAVVEIADAGSDPRLREAAAAARRAGIVGVLAAPLLVRDEVVGLLALYPDGSRVASEHETALLAALAGQLAVAVQNAQLHERATRLGGEREAALAAERDASRRLRALYEVSRSFAQSLSLDETLKALARTAVDVLDVDAALVRMPDERREQLVPHALHVRDAQLEPAIRAMLYRPQAFGARIVQRLYREALPHRLAAEDVAAGPLQALAPFLEKGWTAALVPVSLPTEVLASLSIFSFRPGDPITEETVDAAAAISTQAALAIDNARLYQQQKQFADTMQRSLLPRSRPDVPGLEVGEVYESSARVDVGGDVYDFLALDDGRLAVVLGDVTGHGVEATADMAMAKFVFRSLAREHPEPGDFLAAANDVVCGEIASGKFITMTYVAVDAQRGEVACASAGHPAPRLILPTGEVRSLEASGLVLGIDTGQAYEETRAELPPGASLVLYTDGVVEARRGRELYGVERLDALLAEKRGLSPLALAYTVSGDARDFAGGELPDDLAVVVIRRVE
ncbi:MAG TPA: SpoIIE family protein phosphatase [Gaiellaceae bacterium]|nr:SpoIIE family protein phosphatase [Gaiellaceae bacterium]